MISRKNATSSDEVNTADSSDESTPSATADSALEVTTVDSGEGEFEPLTGQRLLSVIEALLFSASEPLSMKRLRKILKEATPQDIADALLRLEGELLAQGRAYTLVEEAAGFRLLTRQEFAPFIVRLRGEKRAVRLSQAAFETLAVIAYRQPIRRADLELVRGVQCGPILKSLLEWGLISIVGKEESLGRPLLYGTTQLFLEQFGISELKQLPEPEQWEKYAQARGVEVDSATTDRGSLLFPEDSAGRTL